MRKIICMSSLSKLLKKLANIGSDTNWTLDEAILLLELNGFSLRKSGGSSHRVFVHPTYPNLIVLAAHGKKIKTGYVRDIREALAEIRGT